MADNRNATSVEAAVSAAILGQAQAARLFAIAQGRLCRYSVVAQLALRWPNC